MTPLASTPQWFTTVMGTAIVATSTAALPVDSWLLDLVGSAFWILACGLLIVATAHMAWRYTTDRSALRTDLHDPTTAPFFGAVAMAPLAVGGATAAVGPRFLGDHLATSADAALWIVGSVLAVIVAVVVPAVQFTSHQVDTAAANPAWLLPVVGPMVSAATGAVLIGRVDSAAVAQALAYTSLALFGASGLAAALVTASLWWRLAHHQHADAATVPSLWIVLGPLGQSVTALTMLALYAPAAFGLDPAILNVAAVLYGVPVLGFALAWLALSIVVAARVAGRRLPYSMGWWAFTFPVGTCVTGAAGLAAITGAAVFAWVAGFFAVLLILGWCASAVGTARALATRRAARGKSARLPSSAGRVGAAV
ncbi:hypothetical protein [Demequina globuliformis]|uniref:SLAC1 family transporter n=1 Tax=Demequina globuliformis TaxID=676202 RepID=UPI00078677BA|nr:hypothetical protein [Demequina globuliformis]